SPCLGGKPPADCVYWLFRSEPLIPAPAISRCLPVPELLLRAAANAVEHLTVLSQLVSQIREAVFEFFSHLMHLFQPGIPERIELRADSRPLLVISALQLFLQRLFLGQVLARLLFESFESRGHFGRRIRPLRSLWPHIAGRCHVRINGGDPLGLQYFAIPD